MKRIEISEEQRAGGQEGRPVNKTSPRPIGEREEFVSERSELTNSGEGLKECKAVNLPSPDGLCRAKRLSIVLREVFLGKSEACAIEKGVRRTEGVIFAENNEIPPKPQNDTVLSPYSPIALSPLNNKKPDCFVHARNDKSCAKHTEKALSPHSPIALSPSNKKAAFTLAEVLITLAVIGVVAAITIPNVIKKYQEKVFLTKFDQAYSIMSQGFYKIAMDADGSISNLFGSYHDLQHLGKSFYEKYFKINKMCTDFGPHADCLSYTVYNLSKKGTTSEWCGTYMYPMILNNGMIFCIDVGGNERRRVGIDLNGKKGPNVSGIDVFLFKLMDNGTITYFGSYDGSLCDIKYNYNGGGNGRNGHRCSEWVMKYHNMDYLYNSYSNSHKMWK